MYVGHVPQIIGLLKTSMHDQETILAHGTFGRKQTYLCTTGIEMGPPGHVPKIDSTKAFKNRGY